MAEMGDFATFIRQCTQGRGTFTFEFARYEDAPAQVAQKVIEEAKAAQEARANNPKHNLSEKLKIIH